MADYGDRQVREFHVGQVGFREVAGTSAFSGTATTVSITVVPLTTIIPGGLLLTPLGGTSGTDAILHGPVPNTNSGNVEVSSGAITISRSTTNITGLCFAWKAQGR